MTDGIYMYGIIPGSDSQGFSISDNPAVPQVFTISSQDVAVVASINPFTRYESLEQGQAVKDLAIHNFVVEKAMERFTILPVKFGTMLKTRDEVMALLDKGQPLFREMLGRMVGHIELDVVARWEMPEVLTSIARENTQIRARQQAIAQKGGQVSIEDKIVLGQYIGRAVQEKKAHYQQTMVQALRPEAEDVCQHDLASDEMIFNAAFLLPRQREDAFYHAVDVLDQQLESRVHFRIVGPLPPYSFATMEVKRFDSASIEEAKKVLQLPDELSDRSVRDAYYQLARAYHPDTSNVEEAGEFQRINAAYTTLHDFVTNGMIYPQVYQWPDKTK
ncbi:GvpL/GvpF family gas vesicle protein [Dictyobacter aurantiacus]|uniref:J domain-containing protein n=1 Tax=Dictyobacter aurantiacus TaxID=1936993 RepID=A0A401ZGS6_9CHLR|nr:GvpL/GvpF family gas vesicle protein [Dictyobacter aurantiacus]GCE06059.1 hypothetical protein KDAU_33880 [Dictyobacter aurantiacus]